MTPEILTSILTAGFVILPASVISAEIVLSSQDVRVGNGASIANNGVTPPKPITYAAPEYTEEARKRGIEGVVTIQAEFDADGRFKVMRVLKGLGYGLDEAALKALQSWRFAPAYQSGRRVSVVAQIDVTFSLPEDRRTRREEPLRRNDPLGVDRLRTRTLLIAP